jgi:anthranilate 1,2-dioxygenase ferredoxin component
MSEERFVRVAALGDVPDGSLESVDVEGDDVLLARVGDSVFALDNVCSHAEGWLDMGELHQETCEVQCPLHEGRFDLRTGAPTHEPCVEPVRSYPVRVEGEDILVGVAGQA